MKHTKGPWTRIDGERFKHDQSAGVRAGDELYIAAALDLNRTDRDEEVEANARLIAAAPELLETLEWLAEVQHVANFHNTTDWHACSAVTCRTAQRAVAKATTTEAAHA